jgi:membrane fusion protein (multidrug efflux system)
MHFAPRRITKRSANSLIIATLAAILLAGCGERPQLNPGPPQVSVITVQPERTPRIAELPGRVDAVRDAQIRARVTGIVQRIVFQQGGDVKEKALLFKIDPAPYKAAYDQAAAQLKQADLFSAKALADRYAPLVKANAVSKQEYDNAVASYRQADAAVAAAKANLQNASINLGYTDVTSPITGRIGKPLVTEGALVEASSATQMALVQQLDPIYVDFTQSTTDLAALRKAFSAGQLQKVGNDSALAQVVQEDGTEYSHSGKLLFTGITVDPTTGQVNLRAEFPNPDQVLLPGMYVRVRLTQGIDDQALLVPQQALQRTPDGMQSLMLVKDGKIDQVSVTTGGAINGRWVVTSGLKAGDVVVVEGFQKVRPGAPVKVSQWTPAQGGQAPGTAAPPPAQPSGQGAQPGQPGAQGAPQPPAQGAQQGKDAAPAQPSPAQKS